ncbi:MAG: T9SS type A sorting domain-containing protein, partial [Candidatus Cloacimonas acidaminovorans]|nr:T9SS type A sorting domain-containing protein [Candidatus Cloacimonas acidaminovorans]
NPSKTYRVYYWLQNPFNSGGQIYYAQYVSLGQSWIVSNSDEYISQPVISVYPNPLVKGNALKISASVFPAVFTVYNIKGQKVFSTGKVFSEISISADIFPASGIYFLRCEMQDRDKTHKQIQKISIIK